MKFDISSKRADSKTKKCKQKYDLECDINGRVITTSNI